MTKLTPAIRSASATLLVALSAYGCPPDDGSPALVDDDGPAATEATAATGTSPTTPATSAAESSESGFELVCLPGEVRCEGTSSVATCNPTGLGWTEELCAANQMCCEGNATCPEARCLGPCEAEDLLPSSAGCSFIANRQLHIVDGLLEFHGLTDERDEPDAIVIANPSTELIATVQAYFVPEGKNKEEPFGEPVTLAPGEFEVYDLNTAFVAGTTTMFRSGGMYRVQSDAPIIAYQHAPFRAFPGNDSSMLLPEATLGTDYVVASYNPHHEQNEGLGRPTYFEIIATEDETDVRWHAQFAATSGNGLPVDEVPEGEWSASIRMNRYDTLRVTASRNANQEDRDRQDVSGTVVESNKPIWVVGASRCSRVPVRDEPELGFCDPLQELLIPMSFWGQTYVAAHPPLRDTERHHWRIYGADQGTTVSASIDVEGLPYTFQSRGDFVEVSVPNGSNFVLEGDGAFMPVGYLESRHKTGEPEEEQTDKADPAMYQLIPVGQFLSRYVFVTGLEWTVHYVQVVRPLDGPEVMLDGAPIEVFEQVGEFEVANVEVGEGLHTVESTAPIGITQFGLAFSELPGCADPLGVVCNSSYAYPGGMKSEQIYVP